TRRASPATPPNPPKRWPATFSSTLTRSPKPTPSAANPPPPNPNPPPLQPRLPRQNNAVRSTGFQPANSAAQPIHHQLLSSLPSSPPNAREALRPSDQTNFVPLCVFVTSCLRRPHRAVAGVAGSLPPSPSSDSNPSSLNFLLSVLRLIPRKSAALIFTPP